MLSLDKINPLNVLGCREVSDPPPHFHYLQLNLKYNIVESVRQWIYENLRSRFYLGECLQLTDNQFTIQIKIGFEEPKEASFFLLACPLLKYVNH
jgi:hypothetical protein